MTVIIVCDAARRFATALYGACAALAVDHDAWRIESERQRRYPNGEVYFELTTEPAGERAVVVQQLWKTDGPQAINDDLVALLAAARLAKERGASEVVAVVPMLVYHRHDRWESRPRGPVATSFLADIMASAGIDEIVTWHLSDGAVAGWPRAPHLTALDPGAWLAKEFSQYQRDVATVVVSPDHGAESFARKLADQLELVLVCATKTRVSPVAVTDVRIPDGDLQGCRRILVVDDLIVTGSTIYSVIERVRQVCPFSDIEVAVSHFAPVDGDAINRVRSLAERLSVSRIVTSGSASDDIPPEFRELVETRREMLVGAVASHLTGCLPIARDLEKTWDS